MFIVFNDMFMNTHRRIRDSPQVPSETKLDGWPPTLSSDLTYFKASRNLNISV
jgi:hypothetical protein